MKTAHAFLSSVAFSFAAFAFIAVSVAADAPDAAARRSPQAAPAATEAPKDVRAAGEADSKEVDHRRELLEFGFAAASAIPAAPHLRDRAKAQEAVALGFIEAGHAVRAAACALEIGNWRRGSVYGDLAIDCARKGLADSARLYGRFALETVAEGRDGVEDWQRDRVRVKVAQAFALLDDLETAALLERGVGEAEMGKVAAVVASRSEVSEIDALVEMAAVAISTLNFDLTVNAFEVMIELAGKSKGEEARWTRIVELLASTRGRVPRDIEIKTYLRLADVRIAQESPEEARALIATAVGLRDGARWTPDAALPLAAEVARRLHAVGERERARTEIESALEAFHEQIAAVPDVFRAEAMRPAAEALVAMGAVERAREVYASLLEEGARNPNARPRAEDLAESLASLARAGVVPDEAMWARIKAIREGLVDPW